jgi:hypothetical protein
VFLAILTSPPLPLCTYSPHNLTLRGSFILYQLFIDTTSTPVPRCRLFLFISYHLIPSRISLSIQVIDPTLHPFDLSVWYRYLSIITYHVAKPSFIDRVVDAIPSTFICLCRSSILSRLRHPFHLNFILDSIYTQDANGHPRSRGIQIRVVRLCFYIHESWRS